MLCGGLGLKKEVIGGRAGVAEAAGGMAGFVKKEVIGGRVSAMLLVV
jgi:hypothetical protein